MQLTAHVVARAALPQPRGASALAAHVASLDADAIVASVAASYSYVAQPAPESGAALCIYRAPKLVFGAVFRVSPVATPHLVLSRDRFCGALLSQRWNMTVEAQALSLASAPGASKDVAATASMGPALPPPHVVEAISGQSRDIPRRKARESMVARLPLAADADALLGRPTPVPHPSPDTKPSSQSQPLSELGRELAAAALPAGGDFGGMGAGGRRKSLSPSKLRREPRAAFGQGPTSPGFQGPLPPQVVQSTAPPLVFDSPDDAVQRVGLQAGGGGAIGSASATFNFPSVFGSAQPSAANSDDPAVKGLPGTTVSESFDVGSLIGGSGAPKSGPFRLTASAAKLTRQPNAYQALSRPANVTRGSLVFASQYGAPSAAQVGLPLWAALEAVRVRISTACNTAGGGTLPFCSRAGRPRSTISGRCRCTGSRPFRLRPKL